MATPKNTNQNTNGNSGSSSTDSAAGDILSQLRSESVSISNLYKLETKMFKSVSNLDKNFTKQQKVINQAKKNLDTITTAVNSIRQDTGAMRTTLSSVDTHVSRIISILEHQFNGSNNGGNGGNGGNGNADLKDTLDSVDETLQRLTDAIQDLDSTQTRLANDQHRQRSSDRAEQLGSDAFTTLRRKIDEIEIDLQRLDDELAAGNISQADYNQDRAAYEAEHAKLTESLDQLQKAFANSLNQYDEYKTEEQKFNETVNKLAMDFAAGLKSIDELIDEFDQLELGLEEHRSALEEAEKAWKDDGKFSFAKEGRNLEEQLNKDFEDRYKDLKDRFDRGVPDENGNIMDSDAFQQAVDDLIGERETAFNNATGLGGLVHGVDNLTKIGGTLDSLLDKLRSGGTYDAKTGTNTTASATVEALGSIGGTLIGSEVGTALGAAIGGPVGAVVGGVLGDLIGSKIEALGQIIGDQLDYLANHSKKTRDEILKAGLDKIRSDVKDMATYSIEIYENSTKELYAAWDKNLSQITATQGYTKEALNSLQDSVAQKLREEGYGSVIDASQYLDQLANTLNANLGGALAEAFATQNLILQKAVPEVDLSASAAQFAAIYANVNRQGGSGEDAMIAAMNEIAGAAKALEEITEGNNQFLKETSNLLNKATEVVNIAGGNADQISELTAQMMASEAAITSVAPQLNGFTSELVSVLMSNNDATAVSLRAIMNDINSNIGVSATSFMKSFMEDTQSTLSTAFAAIQKFINQNENEASRQEFLHAMESVFGVSGSKLAQIDFGSVADMIDQVNTSVNMAALTNAENLVRAGETTSLEEQLVANTTNQLLATNAISATLDNKLMRKLETNELTMERLVYATQATQSVDLAENTLGFFTKIIDLITSIIDPFGLFDMVETAINASTSALIDAERYTITSAMSSIGSTVADSTAGEANALANTIGGASAVLIAAQTKSTDAMVYAVENSGVSPTFENMMAEYADASKQAQAAIAESSAESNAISYSSIEQQARQTTEYQQKQTAAQEQEAKYEEAKAAAREQQQLAQQSADLRDIETHDNIILIRDALDNIDMSEYLSPILEEHRTHTEQIKELQSQSAEMVRLLSTIIEYNMAVSPEFESNISFDERTRIMDNGYINNSVFA